MSWLPVHLFPSIISMGYMIVINITLFSMPRYPGELFVDSVVDWVATSVVGLPRILYYSKETLVRFMTG